MGKSLAWLEKQGEQKPADKVEPKFKVCDYIINEYGFIMHIDGINGNMYIYHVLDDNGEKSTYDITKTDKSCHLWTIKVDLEKELEDWLGERVGKWTGKECERMCRHFFELGLKTQKGK